MIENFKQHFQRTMGIGSLTGVKLQEGIENDLLFKATQIILQGGLDIDLQNPQPIVDSFVELTKVVKKLYLIDGSYFQILPIQFCLLFLKYIKKISQEMSESIEE